MTKSQNIKKELKYEKVKTLTKELKYDISK